MDKKLLQNYHSREKLLEFYRELSSGYLALQGENGLWHQVLTEEDAYEETSCTSMFVYAFSLEREDLTDCAYARWVDDVCRFTGRISHE